MIDITINNNLNSGNIIKVENDIKGSHESLENKKTMQIGQQVDDFLKGRLDIDRLHKNDYTGELSRKICSIRFNVNYTLNKDDKYSDICLDKISELFVVEDIKMMSQELKDILGNAFMKAIATYVDKYEPQDNYFMSRLGRYVDFIKFLECNLSDENQLQLQKIANTLLDKSIVNGEIEYISYPKVDDIKKFMSKMKVSLSEKHKDLIHKFINNTLKEDSLKFRGLLSLNGIELLPVEEQKINNLVNKKLEELNTLEDIVGTCGFLNRENIALSDEQKELIRQISNKLVESLFNDIQDIISNQPVNLSKELKNTISNITSVAEYTGVTISDEKKKLISEIIDICANDTLRKIKEEPDNMIPRDLTVQPVIDLIFDTFRILEVELSREQYKTLYKLEFLRDHYGYDEYPYDLE